MTATVIPPVVSVVEIMCVTVCLVSVLMVVNYTGADLNVTEAPYVVSVEEMTCVTLWQVSVLMYVNNTGTDPNVTVGIHH